MLEKIFDPYFSTKQEGSGLGLAICHSIISKHDGHISVESRPGMGTTFTIYLPASRQRKIVLDSKTAIQKPDTAYRVMVMDDDEMVRNVADAMLTKLGYRTVFAKDGEEAVQLYKEHRSKEKDIDLIIMDLTIPGGMGGSDAVKEILSINKTAKVIVSSGYSTDPIMADCTAYGFTAAITKPFQLQDLAELVHKVLTGDAQETV